jgi:site-specific DNA-cytosine methylase
MLRAIQEIKPKFVIAENVFGITNIDGGLVFEQVCLDLETEGYEVQPFIIPAAAKNAPHRRDRCWFIATNPTAMDSSNATATMKSTQVKGRDQCIRLHLVRAMAMGMLPTPTDAATGSQNSQHSIAEWGGSGNNITEKDSWKNSQLNPRFVAEMMGFPPNWTELPFLNGEQNQSKVTETP